MTSDNRRLPKSYNEMISREEVIKCPEMMRLLGYLSQTHKLPKYGWQHDGLRYHYTDAAGLLGIIENGRLWATDLRFLNDPSEGSFLPKRLLDLMSSKRGGTSDTERQIIEGLELALLNPRSDYDATYCVSLSANGDLLSQWRGYGDFGKGYAVGLRLEGITAPHPQVAGYYEIVYGDEGLEDLAVDLLDLFVSSFDQWKEHMYDEWASALRILARSFKDHSYSEEQESRLVCRNYDEGPDHFKNELPLRFRAKGSDLIPYIPMSLSLLRDGEEPRLPIERIVVGPGVDFERNSASIRTLLRANTYDDVKIEPSIIPFRP